jgi:uncharacterized damage-inducible protein DinB
MIRVYDWGSNMKKAFIIALENNKKIVKQFFEILTEQEIHRRIKDYWTIYEHMDHLVVCQKILLGRLEQFLIEENPIMKPFVPDDKPKIENKKKEAKELISEFCALRDKQVKLINGAKKNIWEKVGTHEEYEKYSFEILIRHILTHDSFHLFRMEELWIMKEEYVKELK